MNNLDFILWKLFYGLKNTDLKSINECVLPDHLKNTFKEFVEDKHIPNLILSGGSIIGKTTVVKRCLMK